MVYQIQRFRSKNNEAGSVLSEIQEELRTYRQMAGSRVCESETENYDLVLGDSNRKDEALSDRINCEEQLPLENISSRAFGNEEFLIVNPDTDDLTPSTKRVSSDYIDPYRTFRKPSGDESPQKPSFKIQKRNAWKAELNDKINKLEQELEELKLSHLQQVSNLGTFGKNDEKRIPGSDSLLLLDIVSSKSSSPVKMQSHEMGKTFRIVGGAFLEQRSTKRSGNIKEKLMETERIIDRGFNTARELNEKLDILKKKSKKRKDASLQVLVCLLFISYKTSSEI